MSYHVYTTDGVILKRSYFGEADVVLHILTENMGLIVASARSARASVSKLRPALQEYTLATVSCVKGKSSWKVTNISPIKNFYFDGNKYSHRTLAQITSLVLKMMPGEIAHPEVFRIFKNSFNHLMFLPEEKMTSFEILVVLRILHELGYVAPEKIKNYIFSDDFSPELLSSVDENKKILVDVINNSLRASQL